MTRGRRWLRAILIGIASLVGLLITAVVVAALVVDVDALIAKYQDQALEQASQTLGRRVAVERVEATLFPTFGVEASGLTVAGPPGSAEPALVVPSLQLELSLLKALLSLGEEIEVDRVRVEGVIATVSRDRQGRFSFADVLERLEKRPDAPLSPRLQDRLREGRIEQILLADGRIHFTDHAAPRGVASLHAEDLDLRLEDVALGAPIEATVRAALLADEQNFQLDLVTTPLPETIGEEMTLTIERADLLIRDMPLEPLQDYVARLPPTLDAQATVTKEDEVLALAATLSSNGATVKPATFQARGEILGPLGRATVVVDAAQLVLGETVVNAEAKLALADEPRLSLEARAPYLDLDQLRAAFPEPPKQDGAERPDRPDLTADVAIGADRGVLYGIEFSNLTGRLRYQGGRLSVPAFELETYGGRLSAAGTTVNLAIDPPAYDLSVNLSGLQAAELFAKRSGLGPFLGGNLDANLTLSGQGTDWPSISRTLEGRIGGRVAEGRLSTIDLTGAVLGPLANVLPFVEQATGVPLSAQGVTLFERLNASFVVDDQKMTLTQPLRIATDRGVIQLTGAIGLDKTLDLTGTFALSPDTIEALTSGKLRPDTPIPVGLTLGCTLAKPCVEGVAVEQAARTLIASYTRKAGREVQKQLEEEARKRLEDVLGL